MMLAEPHEPGTMTRLDIRKNGLGFEVFDSDQLVTVYRATEELPRTESPKPCFAPIYTPDGNLVTEYRPADHPWHTGLYFGWVRANDSNLWGGPWYIPEREKYELVENSHGIQRHDQFTQLGQRGEGVVAAEKLSWLNAADEVMAAEDRTYTIRKTASPLAYHWTVQTRIAPVGGSLTLGASRLSHYSGFELRLGPPFAEARHRNSEGLEGHENMMEQPARWVSATGAAGGEVIMMDHPDNPRHPVTWFTRFNLVGAGLLMKADLVIEAGAALELQYALVVLAQEPSVDEIESLYSAWIEAVGRNGGKP